jgi:hypothetical protein
VFRQDARLRPQVRNLGIHCARQAAQVPANDHACGSTPPALSNQDPTIAAAEAPSRACHAIELDQLQLGGLSRRWRIFTCASATFAGDGSRFGAAAAGPFGQLAA